MSAEALIFFDPAKAEVVPRLRKRAWASLSKGRYLAARYGRCWRDLWLTKPGAMLLPARWPRPRRPTGLSGRGQRAVRAESAEEAAALQAKA